MEANRDRCDTDILQMLRNLSESILDPPQPNDIFVSGRHVLAKMKLKVVEHTLPVQKQSSALMDGFISQMINAISPALQSIHTD